MDGDLLMPLPPPVPAVVRSLSPLTVRFQGDADSRATKVRNVSGQTLAVDDKVRVQIKRGGFTLSEIVSKQ